MTWTTVTFRVTTPLFSGGADPDGSGGFRAPDGDSIRVASIRGAMRFWFRALAGTVAGPDLGLLAALERDVFGDAGTPSPVQLRIPAQPRVEHTKVPDFLKEGERAKWITYLLGQGLTSYDRSSRGFVLTRPYVPENQEFDVRMRFTSDAAGVLALAALRLCCLYGGLGARTRRGFGGVQIAGVHGPLPGPWTAESLMSRGLRDYAGIRALWPEGKLAECRKIIVGMRGETQPPTSAFDDDWTAPPLYPVLSQSWTLAGVSGGEAFGNWQDTLWHAGEQLRHFRADKPNNSAQARYSPRIETREWIEAIHGEGSHFAVGALGLPVVYKDNYVVNVDRGSGTGAEKLRRASPLWLRPVGSGDNWRLLSFAFLSRFLPGPDAPAVHLWQGGRRGKQLQVTDEDMRSLAGQWINALRADRSFAETATRA